MSASPAGEQAGELQRAEVVVAVGQGIDPATYDMVDDLRAALGGAALGATRKVTDAGWLPRSTQIGVTGHSVAPRLLIALASSGRFNHTIGIRNSRVIMAINADPDAEIFDQVDVGLVGASEQLVPELIEELNARQATTPRSPTVA
jgi:electron transfer flavoprotein alpha subunit